MSISDEVAALLSTYGDALRSGDLGAAVACYTDDAVVAAQAVPTVTGSGVRDLYGQIFSALRLDIAFSVERIVVGTDGEVVVFTHSEGTQTEVTSGNESADANREAFVLTREDGALLISRYLFNTVQ